MINIEPIIHRLTMLNLFLQMKIDNDWKETFDEYLDLKNRLEIGKEYSITHHNSKKELCKLVYFPLVGYKQIRGLLEFKKGDELIYKEMPVKYLI